MDGIAVAFRDFASGIRSFEVVGTHPLASSEARRLERFAAGLAAYRRGRRAEAIAAFEQVLALTPDDKPSQIYLERCRARPEAAASG